MGTAPDPLTSIHIMAALSQKQAVCLRMRASQGRAAACTHAAWLGTMRSHVDHLEPLLQRPGVVIDGLERGEG